MGRQKKVLTITGSDSTGRSGVQADILAISELGGVAVSAITSITVQNMLGIQEFYDLPVAIVRGQIEAIINDVQPEVVKIGLIRSVDVLEVITDMLQKYHPEHVIYDPIFTSSRGERLIGDDVVAQISRRLVPLCTLVTNERFASHGGNNAYSSAVAAFLADGCSLDDAQTRAREYARNKELREGCNPGGGVRASELYRVFLELVSKKFKENNDVAFYADSMNISPRYLAQVCKRVGDRSPKQIIDEYLVRELQRLLHTTDNSIQQIASDTGFRSQAHLSKFFKNITGVSPTEYRRHL